MKKILCIIAVLAMTLSLCGTVALAAETVTYTFSTDEDTYNAGDVFDLYIEGDVKCGNFGLIVDFDEDLFEIVWDEENDDFLYDTGSHTGTVVLNPNGAADCFSIGGMRNKNALASATITIKVLDTAASGTFTFNAVSAGSKSNTLADETILDVAVEPCTITIVGSDPQPTVNKFADFTSDFVVDAATVGGEATDYQIGAGLGMKVSTGDLTFTDMIWSLTTADGKLYSKAIPLGAVNGDVDLVATFVNGVRADNAFGKEPVTTINFTGVNAIFKDADGAEWFTDVTDAK